MTGGPLDGQIIELHPVQEPSGEYGFLSGRNIAPDGPAYVRDRHGRWMWQDKPWPPN